jgi:hypothetical protein
MGGWMDEEGRMEDGWMEDGWMEDGWMEDGWMEDGWMEEDRWKEVRKEGRKGGRKEGRKKERKKERKDDDAYANTRAVCAQKTNLESIDNLVEFLKLCGKVGLVPLSHDTGIIVLVDIGLLEVGRHNV